MKAAVIGAGPNGLAAAIRLAQAGWEVTVHEAADTPGGGCRTQELTLSGFRHDVCSSIHALASASPFFSTLPLQQYGLEWIHPRAPLAHPLDDGRVAVLHRSLEETAATLGSDGAAWKRLFAPFVEHFDLLKREALAPMGRIPRHPFLMARFGLASLPSSTELTASRFEGPLARALFQGCAAHSFSNLDLPLTSAAGLLLGAAGHAVGWPFAKGGSQALVDALVAHLKALGGKVLTQARITELAALDAYDACLFDTDAWQMVRICKDALPSRYQRAVARFTHAPAAFKVDYALDGPIPWKSAACGDAATLHLVGSAEELRDAEAQVAAGKMPARPYVLLAQHSPFDATRAPPGKQTVWAYCHVPYGFTGDATAALEAQLERFAPGFRDRVLARAVMSPAQFAAYNPNYEGGDISAGATHGLQLFARPVLRMNPYSTPDRRVFLCSASTPPGPGVHGMCGFFAAETVLARHGRPSAASPKG